MINPNRPNNFVNFFFWEYFNLTNNLNFCKDVSNRDLEHFGIYHIII